MALDEDVYARCEPYLQLALGSVAQDRGVQQEELTIGLLEALRAYGRACVRIGYDHAHEEDTIVEHPKR